MFVVAKWMIASFSCLCWTVLMECFLVHLVAVPSVPGFSITQGADMYAMAMYLHGANVHTQQLSLFAIKESGKFLTKRRINI